MGAKYGSRQLPATIMPAKHGQNNVYVSLKSRLIASTDFVTAQTLIADQRSNLSALNTQGTDAERVALISGPFYFTFHVYIATCGQLIRIWVLKSQTWEIFYRGTSR
jgi:hypothetical protein